MKKRNKSAGPGGYNSSKNLSSFSPDKSQKSASSKNKSPGTPTGKKEEETSFHVEDF